MNALRFLLALATVFSLAAQTPSALRPEDKAPGWQVLFDGRTLNGWDVHKPGDGRESIWRVEDGWIHRVPRVEGQKQFGSDLATQQSFLDFELVFAWKLPAKGNSGVKYRVQGYLRPKPGITGTARRQDLIVVPEFNHTDHTWNISPIGFEYQIFDDSVTPQHPLSWTAGLYELIAPATHGSLKLGTVHASRILVKGSHVEHWLDGMKTVDADLQSDTVKQALRRNLEGARQIPLPELAFDRAQLAETLLNARMSESPIVLQNHGSEVWFRNIRVRTIHSK